MTNNHRDNLRLAYDRNVAEREGRTLWKRQAQERDDFLARLHTADHRSCLDVGAATGIDGKFFADQGVDVTCIDLSAANVAASHAKGLKAHQMDVTTLEFPDSSFDSVWSWDCLLHLPKAEWAVALAEIKRVMTADGLFFLGVYGGIDFEGVWEDDTYEPKRFYAFWTDENLQNLLSQTFEIIDFHTHRISAAAPAVHFQAVTLKQKSTP